MAIYSNNPSTNITKHWIDIDNGMNVREKFDEWASSEEGKRCLDIPAGTTEQYIKNRFWRAYMLGMKTAREIDKPAFTSTTHPPVESFIKTYKERIHHATIRNKEDKVGYSKLPKLKWLFSDGDFKEMWSSDNEENDWLLMSLWDNGITSPEDAKCRIELQRFEYTTKDCPKCGNMDNHYITTRGWKCKKCAHKFTITSGTYLDNTKLELYYWWRFAYLIGDMKITNSNVIAKDLGITQSSSWFMIETLRNARKQMSDKNFVNGQKVLAFNSLWDVIEVLMKLTKNKKKKNIQKIKRELAPFTPMNETKKNKVLEFLNQKHIDK